MAIQPVHNEPWLLQQVAADSEQAFGELFEAYHQQLGEYVFRLTDSVPVAEEIVQDVFIKLWLKRQSLPQLSSFTNYLFILLRNQTLSYLRKHASERTRYLQWAASLEQPEEAPDETSEQYAAWLEEAVAQLPERQREIFVLSRYHRLTRQQIAAKLDITDNTVKTHLERAVKAIRAHVQDKIPAAVLLVVLWR